MQSIASLKEVGKRLLDRQKSMGVSVDTVTKEGGISKDTWYRWSSGRDEGSCIKVSKLAAFLGFQPNQLLLANPLATPKPFPSLNERDFGAIQEMMSVIDEITGIGGDDWVDRPAEIALQTILAVRDTLRNARMRMHLPLGASVQVDADGVKSFNAPPRKPNRKYETGTNDAPDMMLAEDPAKYGIDGENED